MQTVTPEGFAVKDAEEAIRNTALLPIEGSSFSIAPALQIAAQLAPFQEAAKDLEAQASRAVIDSIEAKQRGVEFASICAEQWTQLETYRKATTGPVYDYWKYMNSLFNPILNQVGGAKKKVLDLMVAFDKEERKREEERQAAFRKKQEEEAQKLALELEAKGDTKGAEAVVEAALAAPVPRPVVQRPMVSSAGKGYSTRKVWTAKVESPMEVLKAIVDGKLPISIIEFRQAELNKVAKDISATTKQLGLNIYQDESGTVR